MARERPPKYLKLNPQAIRSYKPPTEQISRWHFVIDGRRENFTTIATKYALPVEQIIEFNFPGTVENGRLIPEVVNWYLRHHDEFDCPETQDGINRMFKGGETIAIPRAPPPPRKPGQLPTLDEAKEWFVKKVIPLRTAKAGYSANRTWKSPQRWITGNTEDPNGLCGDTTLFVAEEYYRQFKDYRTSDGFIIGMVLWDGEVLNHIANVMLRQNRTSKEQYVYDSARQEAKLLVPEATRICIPKSGQYNNASLLTLWVFDLYYKEKPQTLGSWWTGRDSRRGGVITIGELAAFM